MFNVCMYVRSNNMKWDAERYQAQHNFVWKYGSSLVDVLDPQKGETILDLGCGTGELAHEIFNKGASAVIGMDADPQMIQQAVNQHQFDAAGEERMIDFRVADARSFTVEQQVDAIFSNAALHWVPEADKCVACMAAALKPDTGRLVIEMGGKGNIQEIANFLDRATTTTTSPTDDKTKNPWYFPSIAEYASLLEQHGIEVLDAQLFDRPTDLLKGKDGLRNWILMFGGSYLEGLQDDEVESLLEQAQVELRPNLFNGEYWTADYRRLRIVGRKVATSTAK